MTRDNGSCCQVRPFSGHSKARTRIEPDLGGINCWDLEGFADWGRCATVGVFQVEFTVQMRPYGAVPG